MSNRKAAPTNDCHLGYTDTLKTSQKYFKFCSNFIAHLCINSANFTFCFTSSCLWTKEQYVDWYSV